MARGHRTAVACVASFALILVGCTTSREALRKNPKAVTTSALCRSLSNTTDPEFRLDIYVELARRSVTVDDCAKMVQQQNQAIAAGVALAVIGTAVAVCANNNCGGGAYHPHYQGADWDAIYNRWGQLVWVCREITTGRFTYDSYCYGKVQSDWRWPGPYV